MESLGSYILLASALIFVLEGLIYALFPSQVQNMMRVATQMAPERLRYFGAAMIAFGVLLVWLILNFIDIALQ